MWCAIIFKPCVRMFKIRESFRTAEWISRRSGKFGSIKLKFRIFIGDNSWKWKENCQISLSSMEWHRTSKRTQDLKVLYLWTYFDSSDWPMIHELHWSSTVADVLHLHHELCVLGERFVTANWRGPLNDTEPDLWLLISCRVILWLSVMSRQRYLRVPAFKSLKSADCFVWSLQTFCTWIRWLGFTKFCEIEQQLQKPLTLQRRAEAASVVVLQHITVH